MKKLLLILFILVSLQGFAITYYVSNSGNDSNTGTSEDKPIKTIDKVNTLKLSPGDFVKFKCGDTFYGTITNLGGDNSHVILGTYGNGNKPIITGFTVISGWISEGKGIYSKLLKSEAQTNMVIVDNINTAMGRFPKTGYLTYENFTGNTSITDNELTYTPNWTGSEVVIRKNDWTLDRCIVDNHEHNNITYTSLSSAFDGKAGYGYFFQNHIQALTQIGDWYHDYKSGKFYMYFGSVNPSTKTVKVATLNNLIINTAGKWDDKYRINTVIQDLNLEGCISHAIYCTDWYVSNMFISNCNISYCGSYAILLNGFTNHIENCSITNCANGIYILRENVNIINTDISNIGVIIGQCKDEFPIGIRIRSNKATIKYNRITNIGYNGICFDPNANINIVNNYIKNTCLILSDGGAIYTAGNHVNCKIQNNIISNVVGNNQGTPNANNSSSGIYLDEYASNIEVNANIIEKCTQDGIKLHKSSSCNIHHNLIFDCDAFLVEYLNSDIKSTIDKQLLNNNILIAKNSRQIALQLTSYQINDTKSFGITSDYNYFARPINDNLTIQTGSPANWVNLMSLNQWRIYKSQDAYSNKSPVSIVDENELHLIYNETQSDKTFYISNSMVDVINHAYSDSITLKPFEGKVLIGNGSISNKIILPTVIEPKYYYVSPSGNNSNPGTEQRPFKTITFALSKMTENDILVVFGGSLSIYQSNSKTKLYLTKKMIKN